MSFKQSKFERPPVPEEEPEINKRKNQEEGEEKANEFRQFLAEQIMLPKEKWDEKFLKYVKEKSQEVEIEPQTPEEERKQVFERYLKNLDLRIEDLKDKRVLDLGSGKRSEFVRECINRGITQDICGLDKRIVPEEVEEALKPHLIKRDFIHEFPVKELDLIITHATLLSPNSETKKVIENALSVLKENGEIRLYPVATGPKENILKQYGYTPEEWEEFLDELSKESDVSYEIRPIDIVVEENKGVSLYQMVVIRKQEKR